MMPPLPPATLADDLRQRIDAALLVAKQYADIEGDHHRMWVIDQMVRALTGADYDAWVQNWEHPNLDGWEDAEWDTGIAP